MSIAFDHRDVGTPEASWAAPIAALTQVSAPVSGDDVLVVAAHPDDETLGAGGLIALAARNGARVRVVVASDGENSHPLSPSHTPAQLAALRRAEVTSAVARLAPEAAVSFLGLPDGGLDTCLAALTVQLTELSATCSHVVSPWAHDQHPDHHACATAAAAAARSRGAAHWRYPIWLWHWGDPDTDAPWAALRRLSLPADVAAVKLHALACHTSQHTPLSGAVGDEAILSDAMRSHFERDSEVFDVSPDAATPDYFDNLYRESSDPWGLADRWYERRKREVLLASLPRERFGRAFEPGCATGLLTARLAERCNRVVAWDGARDAVEQARARVPATHALVECRRIPDDWPSGTFDLIVLSEVGYYCLDLDLLAERVRTSLDARGVLIACHWLHPAHEHPQRTEAVHDALGATLHRIVHHVELDFRLDVWSRDGQSVASVEGIVA